MLIQLSDIILHDGKSEEFQVSLEINAISMKLGNFPICEKSPFYFVITNLGDGRLEIAGKGYVTVNIPCDRCLEDVPVRFDLDIARKVDMNQSEVDRIKDLDETNYIKKTDLDVDQLIYNEVLIEWPLKVLCREDCKGICSNCGANLNDGDCSCTHEEKIDPRMAAISDIFSKFKEV